jgi:HEAT repeat protein
MFNVTNMFHVLSSRRTLWIVGLAVLSAVSCRDRIEGRVSRVLNWERDPSAKNVDRIRESLADEDGQVRAGALAALVRLRVADAKERSRAALGDPDSAVRAAAVEGLLDLRDSEAVPGLARVAVADPDWRARRGAVEAVGALGALGGAADVLPALGDSSSQVRLAAVEAVARLGPAVALQPLAKLAEGDASWEVRAAAVEALGRTAVGEAYASLAVATRDPNEFVRGAAAAALRNMRRRGVAEPEEAMPSPAAPAPPGAVPPGRPPATGPSRPGGEARP